MIRRLIPGMILGFLMPFSMLAQELEFGINLGGANYWGDLAPSPVMSETKLAYGVFGRLNLSSTFAFTAMITTGTVTGNDNNFEFNKDRNLNFSTEISEYAALVEFNFFHYGMRPVDKKYTPYVFLGVSIFSYNPQTTYFGETIDLRNIQTEGVNYGVQSYAIPFGMGFKWQFKRSMAIEASLGFRKTFTDYIDDVSTVYPDLEVVRQKKGVLAANLTDRSQELHSGVYQNGLGYRRGNSDFTDWYMFGLFTFTCRINKTIKCGRFL